MHTTPTVLVSITLNNVLPLFFSVYLGFPSFYFCVYVLE